MKNRYETRGEVTAIFLRRNNKRIVMETIIDTADLPKAMELPGTWYAVWCENTKTFYCHMAGRRADYSRIMVRLHRHLLNAPPELFVDHENHDTLDNRRSNLRLATPAQNQQNLAGPRRNNKTSGIRGVYWDKKNRAWIAQATANGDKRHIGTFPTPEAAAVAVTKWRAERMPFSAMDAPPADDTDLLTRTSV